MGNTVKKPIKGSWNNIGTIESWLSDMAKRGLMLRKLEFRHAIFEETVRQKVEYRVKMFDFYPKDKGVIVEEHINDFDELGWDIVTIYQNAHIYRCSYKESYKELPTAEEEKEYRLQKLNQRYVSALIIALVCLAYLSVHFFVLDRYAMDMDFVLFICVGSVYFVITVLIAISYLVNRMKIARNSYTHHERWKLVRLRWWVVGLMYILIFIAVLVVT